MTSESSYFRVSYELEPADFRDASKAHRPRWNDYLVGGGEVVWGVVLCAGAVYALVDRKDYYAMAILLVLGSLSSLRGILVLGWMSIRFGKSELPSELRGVREAEFDKESIVFRSPIQLVTTKWTDYSRFQVTDRLIILCVKNKEVRIIPKRALSGAQLNSLLDVVHRHLPAGRCPKNPEVLV